MRKFRIVWVSRRGARAKRMLSEDSGNVRWCESPIATWRDWPTRLEIGKELTGVAEACLKAAAVFAQADREGRPGMPPAPLRIAALGKLGSRQLHYSSDLDLMFLYEEPEGAVSSELRAEVQRAQERRVERILHLLADVTAEGVAYRLDLRLRPEGSSGLLARSWTSFVDYARQFMQPWERMALLRCRMLDPSENWVHHWNTLLAEIVYDFDWNDDAVASIRHLKKRIETEKNRESRIHLDFKYGKGGIADLEFLVQFLQLLYGRKERAYAPRAPPLRSRPCNGRERVSISGTRRDPVDGSSLSPAGGENRYQLMEEWGAREIARESPQLVRLARSIGITAQTRSQVREARFLERWEDQTRHESQEPGRATLYGR